MREKNHLALLNNYRSQINKMWIGFFIALFIILSLAIKILTTVTSEKTIIVPAGFNQPFTVKGDQYSNTYKEQMATYLLQLLFNYQPKNVKYQFNQFLQYAHPTVSETLNRKLNADARSVIQKKSSSVFYPQQVRVEDNDTYVTGKLIGMVGKAIVTDEVKTFKLTFDTNGGFFVYGLNEVIKINDSYDVVATEELNVLEEGN